MPFKKWWLSCCLIILCASSSFGQLTMDLSVGTSQEDNFATQIGVRKQFNPQLRAGLVFQYGSPNYRLIGAKPFENNGYATSIAIPVTWAISRQEKIELHGFAKAGLRWQGVIDPDGNDMRDSLFSSTAVIGEIGLFTFVPLSQSWGLQSGITFPISYELTPLVLFENLTSNLHLGTAYQMEKAVLFLKGNIGPSFGGSGDTQKFLWTIQAGIRIGINSGSGANFQLIESSL